MPGIAIGKSLVERYFQNLHRNLVAVFFPLILLPLCSVRRSTSRTASFKSVLSLMALDLAPTPNLTSATVQPSCCSVDLVAGDQIRPFEILAGASSTDGAINCVLPPLGSISGTVREDTDLMRKVKDNWSPCG